MSLGKIKAEVQGNKLTDVDVTHVSIVTKPANRLPIKMMKSEDGTMIDLSKISVANLFKKEAPKPFVAAAFVNKSADQAKVVERLKASDLTAGTPVEAGDILIYAQDGVDLSKFDAAKTTMIKFDEEIALAVEGVVDLKKYFESYNFESTSFKELMAQEGFWPAMRTAQDILSIGISNAMYADDATPESVTKAVTGLCKDFTAYVTEYIKSVPAKAFKMDKSIAKTAEVKAGPETPAAETKVETAKADEAKAPEAAPKVEETKKDEPGKDQEKTAEAPSAAAPAAGQETQKSDNPPAPNADSFAKIVEAAMAKQAEATKALFDGLTKSVNDQIGTLTTKVDQTATLAKSAADKLGTTVLSDTPQERIGHSKSEDDGGGSFEHFDTAIRRPAA